MPVFHGDLPRKVSVGLLCLMAMMGMGRWGSLQQKAPTVQWYMDENPLLHTDWKITILTPEDFKVDTLTMHTPKKGRVVYCEPNLPRVCKEIISARVKIKNENLMITIEVYDMDLDDCGRYHFNLKVADRDYTAEHTVVIEVRKSPNITSLTVTPKDLTNMVEGSTIQVVCEIDCGHVAALAFLMKFNIKYFETIDYHKFRAAGNEPDELFLTYKSNMTLLAGDSYVECEALNTFGDRDHERTWITVVAKHRFVVDETVTIYCFTDFDSLKRKRMSLVKRVCWKDGEMINHNNKYKLVDYDRYFLIVIQRADATSSGNFSCLLTFCRGSSSSCVQKSTCQNTIDVFRAMKVEAFTVKQPLIADDLMWVYVKSNPGQYWRRAFYRIYWFDVPETFRMYPPLREITFLDSKEIVVNVTSTLTSPSGNLSKLVVCMELINPDNLPTNESECMSLPVMQGLQGRLYTVPPVSENQRLPIYTDILCTGVTSYPSPNYTWERLSSSMLRYHKGEVPKLFIKGAVLSIQDSLEVQSHAYEYRCTVSLFDKKMTLDIKFIVKLCEHEPVIDLIIPVSTQLLTSCGEKNTQGLEFFSVSYKPFLARMIRALPLTPRKTRVSLIPYLNYENQHNGTYVSFDEPHRVLKELDRYASQYKSSTTKPCDGMMLPCTGNAFRNIDSKIKSLRKDVSTIILIARDISGCSLPDQDSTEIDKYARKLKDMGAYIWVVYPGDDAGVSSSEKDLISATREFNLLPGFSLKEIGASTCCDLSLKRATYSIFPTEVHQAICSQTNWTKNPEGPPEITIFPNFTYDGCQSVVTCRGNTGEPLGKITMCIVATEDGSCQTNLEEVSTKTESQIVTVVSNLTMVRDLNKHWIKCVATNDMLVPGYDLEYSSLYPIQFTEHLMAYLIVYVEPALIKEGDPVKIICSFNLPIPPPLLTVTLQKVGLQRLVVLTEHIDAKADAEAFKQQLLSMNVTATIPSILNDWDEAIATCALTNAGHEMATDRMIFVDQTKVRTPSLIFHYGSLDKKLQLNTSTFLKEGLMIAANCSGKVGNINHKLTLVILHSMVRDEIVNDHNECRVKHNASLSNYKCREVRGITRNEDFREIIFVISKLSSKGGWVNYSCEASNALNTLSVNVTYPVNLDASINHFSLKTGRTIVCNGSGNPRVEMNLKVVSVFPGDADDLVSFLKPSTTHISSSSEIAIVIPDNFKGMVIMKCTCENIIEGVKYNVFYERSFSFLDGDNEVVMLSITPSTVPVTEEITFTCEFNSYLYNYIQFVMLYQVINTQKLGVQSFPLIARPIVEKSVPFGMWKHVVILHDEITKGNSTVWKLTIKPISRWMAGEYICLIHYEGGAKDVSEPPSKLQVVDKPSLPVIVVVQNQTATNILEVGERFYVVCSSNVGLPNENGAVTLYLNESLQRVDHYKSENNIDGTKKVIVIKIDEASKKKHSNIVYRCEAVNVIGNISALSERIVIEYPPKSLRLIPRNKHVFFPNETITCISRSRPPAKYNWVMTSSPQSPVLADNKTFMAGAILFLDVLTHGLYTFECHAFNSHGTSWRKIVFFVTMQSNISRDMSYNPHIPNIGGHLSFICLHFLGPSSITAFMKMMRLVIWFKISPEDRRQQPFLSYNFKTGVWRYFQKRKGMFMRSSPELRLDITNVTEADFGMYGCKVVIDDNTTMTMLTPEVCIMDLPLKTEIGINVPGGCIDEGNRMKITCTGYSGRLICNNFMIKELTLKAHISYNPRGREKFEKEFELKTINGSALETMSIAADYIEDVTTVELHRATAFCQLDGRFSEEDAKVISWTPMWQEKESKDLLMSKIVNICIMFSPRAIHIEPSPNAIRPGSQMICTAWSNPRPFLEWKVNGTWPLVSGVDRATLTIPWDTKTGIFQASCTATNVVGKRTLSTTSEIVISVRQSVRRKWLRLFLMLLGVAILAVLVGVLLCLLLKCLAASKRLYRSRAAAGSREVAPREADDSDVSLVPDNYRPRLTDKDLTDLVTLNKQHGEHYDRLCCQEPPDVDDSGPGGRAYPSWKVVTNRSVLSEDQRQLLP